METKDGSDKRNAAVIQMAEGSTFNREDVGSNPTGGIIIFVHGYTRMEAAEC